MVWHKTKHGIYKEVERVFSFEDSLVYLNRNPLECMHRVLNGRVYKLYQWCDEMIMTETFYDEPHLRVRFPDRQPSPEAMDYIGRCVWESFDLDADMESFYQQVQKDTVMGVLAERYHGLRILRINDLFESICWAIMGQQINLTFAYTLKHRLADTFGSHADFEGNRYYVFPKATTIAELEVEDLRKLQFTTRKSEYLIGVSRLFKSGELSTEGVRGLPDYNAQHARLMKIRGIGSWTADYALMKCYGSPSAFPIADVGLHNALKSIMQMDTKPSQERILKLAENWKGFEAYATFYLWRSLYDEPLL